MSSKNEKPDVFCKKSVLRNFAKFTGKHLRQGLYFNKVAGLASNFIKIETMSQVPSCEFCKISKNTFCSRTPQVAAYVKSFFLPLSLLYLLAFLL